MHSRVIVYSLFTIFLLYNPTFVVSVYAQNVCGTTPWGPPLEGELKVASHFNPPHHYGTDYKAADGDNVLAVADGKILKIGYQVKQLSKPNPRTGLMIGGWGRYVVVEHTGGSHTLYAHLLMDSTNHLYDGMPVTKGAKIGEADSTGGVTGPHLHLEYSPSGEIFDKDSKVDPHICMTPCPEPPVPLTIIGTETITTNSSAQYTATGCPSNVAWSVSGNGATISSTGLLTVGSTACGTLTITATCSGCETSATQHVRVTDAGGWGEAYFVCSTEYSCRGCPFNGYCCIRGYTKIVNGELWYQDWFVVEPTMPCSCIVTEYNCPQILPFIPFPSSCPASYKDCPIIYNAVKQPWVCN